MEEKLYYKGYISKGNELRYYEGYEDDIPNDFIKITLEMYELNKSKLITEVDENLIEINDIIKWFRDNDYIELQASRGTIERDSVKYQNYLNEYNIKLNRLKQLRNLK